MISWPLWAALGFRMLVTVIAITGIGLVVSSLVINALNRSRCGNCGVRFRQDFVKKCFMCGAKIGFTVD